MTNKQNEDLDFSVSVSETLSSSDAHHSGSHHSGSHHSSSHHSHGSSHHSGKSHRSRHHSGSHHSSSHHSSHSSSHHSSSHHGDSHHTSHTSSASGETSAAAEVDSSASTSSHSTEKSSRHHSHTRVDTGRIDQLVSKYQVVADEDILKVRPPKYHHHHRSRRSRRLRKAFIAIACILLALILAAGATFAALTLIGRKQISDSTVGVQTNPYSVNYDEGRTVEYKGQKYTLNTDIVPIMLIGLDRSEFGLIGDKIGTAGQADLVLLAALDLKSGLVSAILIPRDSMVDVDQYSTDGQFVGVDNMQLCLSFAYGDGHETSAKNVLASAQRILYGIPVQLYGVLDLDGIPSLNDAIGGITLNALETFGSFTKGEAVTLMGMDAQAYVRARNTEVLDSDTSRRARQVQYLQAYVQKTIRSAVSDFGVISRLYNTASQYAFTNVSLPKVTYLASTLLTKGVSVGEITSLPGKMVDAEPYAEYHLDEEAVFETVLSIFYTPVLN